MKSIIENISAEDLDKYSGEIHGIIKIVDVRKKSKYMQGHIKGAINIPYEDIIAERYKLPQDGLIIVYCDRGGMSILAAKKLLEKGYMVKNVIGGLKNYRGKNIV